ncbi:hypothetical protein AMST5_01924 [freshwater sediment metagenome]|uniref:Uncharacterized protein n=1 Tax=freshwater sediment metagenome TaxID=556182 RepID=A0AA48LZA4_9ZZZZ
MTPAQARQSLARMLDAHGETVTLKRGAASYCVRARIMGASPSDVTGSVQQLGRKAIVSAEDVEAIEFPTPFRPKQDRLVWNGKTLVISAVDDATRRIQGELVAYELELSGA